LLSVNSNENSTYQIRNVHVTKGLITFLDADILGKSSESGSTVQYEFEVGNSTEKAQGIQLKLEKMGWESMQAKIEPAILNLAPGEIQKCVLSVTIPKHIPQGIREKQIVKAIANGSGGSAVSLEFTTAVSIPFPNIVFTEEGWQNIREKVDKYDWAQKGLEDYIKKAEKWNVPSANDFSKETERPLGKSVFNSLAAQAYDCGVAYQLTKNEDYVAKCLKLLRPLIDPDTGYRTTLVGGSNSFVGEGKFWQAVSRMYDLIRNSSLVTKEDKRLTEETFRLFVTQTLKGNTKGAISNWNVAELTAAMYCALNLQDWHLINQLLHNSTGIYKHLEHGIMH